MKNIDDETVSRFFSQFVRVPNIAQETFDEIYLSLDPLTSAQMVDVPQKPEGEHYTRAEFEAAFEETPYTLSTLITYNNVARAIEKMTRPFQFDEDMSDEENMARFTPEYIAKGLEYMQTVVREYRKKWEEKNGKPYPWTYENLK